MTTSSGGCAKPRATSSTGRSPRGTPRPRPPTTGTPSVEDPAALLAERIEDFNATVTRVDADGVAEAVVAIAERHGAKRFAYARGLEPEWLPGGLDLVEEPELSVQELDEVDGVITGCTLAIAATGTFVLDGGPGQGPRRLTLVPDLHVCVVREDQIVPGVPQAVAALRDAAAARAAADVRLRAVRHVGHRARPGRGRARPAPARGRAAGLEAGGQLALEQGAAVQAHRLEVAAQLEVHQPVQARPAPAVRVPRSSLDPATSASGCLHAPSAPTCDQVEAAGEAASELAAGTVRRTKST